MNKNKESLNEDSAQLEWIQLREDMGFEALKNEESALDKLKRKFAENPFVPIGCGLTAAALSYGLWSFRQGRPEMSQKMMRYRIGAQGFTVAALLFGVGMSLKDQVTGPSK